MQGDKELEDIIRRQWRNWRHKKWLDANPEKKKEYRRKAPAARKKWKKEHKALLDYKHRLKQQDPEFRKKRAEWAKKWRKTSQAYKKLYERQRFKAQRWDNIKRRWDKNVLLWWGPRCVQCGCKFYADNGEHINRKFILCNDCIDELNAHDEAQFAPREIIEYEHEAGWVSTVLMFKIEYGKNLGYYYIPD